MADLQQNENISETHVSDPISEKVYAEDAGTVSSIATLPSKEFRDTFNYVQEFAASWLLIVNEEIDVSSASGPKIFYTLDGKIQGVKDHVNSRAYTQDIFPINFDGPSMYNGYRCCPEYKIVVYGFQHMLGEIFATYWPVTTDQFTKLSGRRYSYSTWPKTNLFTNAVNHMSWSVASGRQVLRASISRESVMQLSSYWNYTIPWATKGTNFDLGTFTIGTVTGLFVREGANPKLKVQIYKRYTGLSFLGFTANLGAVTKNLTVKDETSTRTVSVVGSSVTTLPSLQVLGDIAMTSTYANTPQ